MPQQSAPGDLASQLAEQRRKVDFDSYDITVQQLLAMVEGGSINVAPAYQRQYRWDVTRQSRFIESIFLGIPIPSLFMAANADGTWELVDGVQRLSTLVHFAGNEKSRKKLGMAASLKLEDLEKLTQFSGGFDVLPQSIQLNFLLRPIKVTTLSDKSDLIVRFDLFERLNTGGVALTDQEIRSCIFRGPFNDFLERMAKNKDFKEVVRMPESKEKDGTREDYALRFFAFLHNYKKFDHSVVDFLNSYMKSATASFDFAAAEQVFITTFGTLNKALPDGITRGRRVTPVNLYEAVAVGAALAIKKNGKIKTTGLANWISSDDLTRLTTGATNDRKRVTGRIEFAAKKFGW
jgi:hypothetical protein